jgi:hypothetical protein
MPGRVSVEVSVGRLAGESVEESVRSAGEVVEVRMSAGESVGEVVGVRVSAGESAGGVAGRLSMGRPSRPVSLTVPSGS